MSELTQTELARMKNAGRDGDRAVIRDTLPLFREELAALATRIGEALIHLQTGEGGKEAVTETLARLQKALEAKDIDAIYSELPRLQSLPLTGEQRDAIGEIVDLILTPDFQKAAEAVKVLLGRISGRADKGETA
jgi:hypothetical protein